MGNATCGKQLPSSRPVDTEGSEVPQPEKKQVDSRIDSSRKAKNQKSKKNENESPIESNENMHEKMDKVVSL